MTIILKNQTSNGEELQATFLPEMGMNMISYRKGAIEVIDQTTKNLFEERFAGLGALIGPHFHRRNPSIIPPIKDEHLFPHLAKVKAKGNVDPFSHGIARYAPWKTQSTETEIKATLSGKDTWNGIPLSALEGQNFTMQFQISLKTNGLHLDLSVVSETDSLVGIHYYYALPDKQGKIISDVKDAYLDQKELKKIPSFWNYNSQHVLMFDLSHPADYTFHPFIDPLSGNILLETASYRLKTHYTCPSQENAWQLYHPEGSTFVCIEPVSSQNPRNPNLSVSSIHIEIEILPNLKTEE